MSVRNRRRGMSLVEIVVALGLLSVVLVGLMDLTALTHRQLDESNDRAVALAAAQHTAELLGAMALPDALAFDGATFDVQGMTTTRGDSLGRIDVEDLRWDGSAGEAYRFTIGVRDARTGQEFAVINLVRSRA